MDLKGKVVLITGANGVLGSAVAQQARALGAGLVLLDLQTRDSPVIFGQGRDQSINEFSRYVRAGTIMDQDLIDGSIRHKNAKSFWEWNAVAQGRILLAASFFPGICHLISDQRTFISPLRAPTLRHSLISEQSGLARPRSHSRIF